MTKLVSCSVLSACFSLGLIASAPTAVAGATQCTTTKVTAPDGTVTEKTEYLCTGSVNACNDFTTTQKENDTAAGIVDTAFFLTDRLPDTGVVLVGMQRFDPDEVDILVERSVDVRITDGREIATPGKDAMVTVTQAGRTLYRQRVPLEAVQIADPAIGATTGFAQHFAAAARTPIDADALVAMRRTAYKE